MTVLPCGEEALLVEVADLDEVAWLDDALASLAAGGGDPWSSIVDKVPAARTVLLTVGDAGDLPALRGAVTDLLRARAVGAGLGGVRGDRPSGPAGEILDVGVRYDGPDLADVARLTGLDEASVIAAHTGRPWRVGFLGFMPGFAYLAGGDPRLVVPRRTEPRTAVPVGAVGLAGPFTGAYPRSSPGGWQLIGRTDAVLWDPRRTPPALLRPGQWVRFVAVD